MPHCILPVEDVDIPHITEILYHSQIPDGIQQYLASAWPNLDTVQGRSDAGSRILQLKAHIRDPSHFLKVVDENTESIVAFTVLLSHLEPPKTIPGLSTIGCATEEDREYAQDLKKQRDALLLRTMSRLQGPVTEVLAFFVDAPQQKQGIGALLMQHLISLDKHRGAPLVLLANPPAVGFYEKQGFRVLENALLTVPQKWQSRPPAYLVSMIFEH